MRIGDRVTANTVSGWKLGEVIDVAGGRVRVRIMAECRFDDGSWRWLPVVSWFRAGEVSPFGDFA